MNKAKITSLNSYNENTLLEVKITEILALDISSRKKKHMLLQLKSSAVSPLARSHISYYCKQIHEQEFIRYERILAILPIPLFLAFITMGTEIFIFLNLILVLIIFILGYIRHKSI